MSRAVLFGVIGAILSSAPSISPQSEVVRKRQVIERVVCQKDPAQSYALYLPSGYTHEREWPIIYCFDYIGNGKVPVERFRDAAETYGYIIA